MSKFRIPFAVFLVILVVPVWVAGSVTALCHQPAAGPHQCLMAQEATASVPASRQGSVDRFVQCHCGSIPPVVNDQVRTAPQLAQTATVTTAQPSGEDNAAPISRLMTDGMRVRPAPPGASFLIHCAFLI